MKRNMAYMFLPHAFIALVDSVCIFNMLPVCCAAIIFKTFQNIAFSHSWACMIVLYHVFFFGVCVCLFLWCSALVEVLFGFTASSTNLTLWFSPERSNRVYVRQPVCFLCSEPLRARIWKIGVEFITRFPCKTLERLVHDCSQCTCCSALLVESCHVWDAEIWSAHKSE